MGPIKIEPTKALDEALTTQRKLAAALDTLRKVDDVDFGVTAKEEIYREDKLVVYPLPREPPPTPNVPIQIL
jgi:polyhydroxyalkanoate synthase